ncbi:MAG: PDZ domain-containing protein [Candidatus Latescibacteria bacterium]|nr:PDZ domain-containing protein [Candidatus Latescibacterota bacterium]
MRRLTLALLCCATAAAGPAAAAEARLLRMPDISAEMVAFVHAGDVWLADRDGGEARRLTTFDGFEAAPKFSPDGRQIAFSGKYDGNLDVYVVGVEGGEPRRLTWHPGDDLVRGWTPDGSRVVFASGRETVPRSQPKLMTIGLRGGLPEALPLPRAAAGALSPDGKRLAYQLVEPWEAEWRNYRGGQAQPVRVVDLATLAVTKLPWDGSNDLAPVWLGGTIFFLSDRDLAMNVWAYDVATGALTQRTHFKEFDCKNLGGGAGRLVFENGGRLYALDAAGGEPLPLTVTLSGDFPGARPHWEDVAKLIADMALSPAGKRVAFEARGEIFTVPAEKGDIRNLTNSPGAADRAPAWSPDGRLISWFSDESGEYELVIADQFGGNRRTVKLPDPTFYYTPRWSPDSKHLAFGDADRVLWVVDAASGKLTRIDDEGFAHPERHIAPVWSPDSRWIAYTKRLTSQFSTVCVYSLETGKSTRITDGLADALSPAWDASGKYLAFLASTDYGLNVGWLDMSSYNQPLNRSLYLAVLDKDEPSPLKPQSDDEEPEAEDKDGKDEGKKDDDKKDEAKQDDVVVSIDFAGLDQRIVALDVPPRNYERLVAGAAGTFFYAENVPNQPGLTLHAYDLEKRETTKLTEGILAYRVSADGQKLLQAKPGEKFLLTGADGKAEEGKGDLDLSGLRMKVDPAAEWRQIFREAWRFQRDFFYVKNVHGLDLDWAYRAYAPWVEHVRHRADLTYVLDILGGETSIGHSFTGGGDEPEVETVPVGLLGCDFEIANGRYRLRRIYTGENWNPELRAPLSGPGIDARVGDYLLEVDGVELTADMSPYSLFDRKADRQTILTLNDKPDLKGARKVTVVPVADEEPLRQRVWIEDNRRRVDELSGGKLAYVWIPDTGQEGYAAFLRGYFAQQDKRGAVIDERYNHGGSIADLMVDVMNRKLLGYFNNPVGGRQPFTAPNAAIWGPKVLLINEMAGSGGDMLPYMFRKLGIGPLVGTRTWGGLVGIWDVPGLIDGGFITAPRGGFYDTDGKWAVEGEGVAPDIEVEDTPAAAREGRDLQLEAAVRAALDLLPGAAIELLPQPADPVRSRRPR